MATIAWRNNRVYLNDVDYFGNAEEGRVEIKRKFAEIDGMGLPAPAKVPTGKFEPLTASLKMTNISPSNIQSMVSNDGYVSLRLVGECRILDAQDGMIADDSLTTIVRGYTESFPVPGRKISDKADGEITINCLFVEVQNDAGTILKINVPDAVVEPANLA
jgi:phage tail tube protein FII